MENKFSHLQVGDKVFICNYGHSGYSFIEGTVVKKTPKGFLDITYTAYAGSLRRFHPKGDVIGGVYSSDYIDDMPFEARKSFIANKAKIRTVINLFEAAEMKTGFNYDSTTKEDLLAEAARLETLITSVRKECESL